MVPEGRVNERDGKFRNKSKKRKRKINRKPGQKLKREERERLRDYDVRPERVGSIKEKSTRNDAITTSTRIEGFFHGYRASRIIEARE